jgi:hypothetical protein
MKNPSQPIPRPGAHAIVRPADLRATVRALTACGIKVLRVDIKGDQLKILTDGAAVGYEAEEHQAA